LFFTGFESRNNHLERRRAVYASGYRF
jgi:hypothetical protein